MSIVLPQTSFSEADLLSAGATLRFIYILHASNDPECRPRYVGLTNNPKKRLGNHNCKNVNGRKVSWIKSVKQSGGKIVMKVVFTFRSDDLTECSIQEALFIEKYRSEYSDLLNDGAAGVGIAKMTKWHKAAISRGNKGKKKSPEHAAKCRVARLGIPHSDEVRRKISQSGKGKKRSPEQLENYRKAAALRWADPKYREWWAEMQKKKKLKKQLDEY